MLRHRWTGDAQCEAATDYRAALPDRLEKEAQQLASLTGWDINKIRSKMELAPRVDTPSSSDKKWWERLWN